MPHNPGQLIYIYFNAMHSIFNMEYSEILRSLLCIIIIYMYIDFPTFLKIASFCDVNGDTLFYNNGHSYNNYNLLPVVFIFVDFARRWRCKTITFIVKFLCELFVGTLKNHSHSKVWDIFRII